MSRRCELGMHNSSSESTSARTSSPGTTTLPSLCCASSSVRKTYLIDGIIISSQRCPWPVSFSCNLALHCMAHVTLLTHHFQIQPTSASQLTERTSVFGEMPVFQQVGQHMHGMTWGGGGVNEHMDGDRPARGRVTWEAVLGGAETSC